MAQRRPQSDNGAPPHGAFPQFAPVPLRARHDGWTPDRQRRFIEALATTGCVTEAARAAQMSLEAAYTLRRRHQAQEFRRAWEEALDLACELLEDVAMTRAIEGVEQPVYHFGEIIGTRRVYNDRLLMFLLRNRRPARFAADSARNADDATQAQLDRLKAEWRKQWEAERAQRSHVSVEQVRANIDRKMAEMRERVFARMSPRAKALREEADAAQREDEANGWLPDYSHCGGDDWGAGEEPKE